MAKKKVAPTPSGLLGYSFRFPREPKTTQVKKISTIEVSQDQSDRLASIQFTNTVTSGADEQTDFTTTNDLLISIINVNFVVTEGTTGGHCSVRIRIGGVAGTSTGGANFKIGGGHFLENPGMFTHTITPIKLYLPKGTPIRIEYDVFTNPAGATADFEIAFIGSVVSDSRF